MKQDTGKRALEGYKIFPYIAWGLTFGFAVFLYTLVSDLQDTTEQLQNQTQALQQQIANDPHSADFDQYNDNRYQPNTN